MSRRCVPGLLAFLAVAPLTAPARDDPFAVELAAEDDLVDVEIVAEDGDDDEKPATGDTDAGKHKLSDEDAKAVQEFVKKASAARQKQVEKSMSKRTAELAKAAQLDDATKKKLDALSTEAVSASQKTWEEKFTEWLTPMATRNGAPVTEMLKAWKPEQIAAANNFGGATAPDRTPEWTEGLKKALTAEQIASIKTWEETRLGKLREEFKDYIDASEAQAGEAMDSVMDAAVSRILKFGDIDEERQKSLRAAASQAVKATLGEWRGRVEKQLLEMDDTARQQLAKRGGSMGVNTADKDNQPQEQAIWKEALAKHLKAEELSKIETRRGEIRSRRAEALGLTLLTDLDRMVGFSQQQRLTLLEWIGKPLLKLPDSYFESPENGYYSLDLAEMLRRAREVDEKQLSELLDAGQLKRWKAVKPEHLSRNGYVRERMDPGKLPKPEEMDEVEVERILSGFLHREAKKMKQKMQAIMESQVENIKRVTGPPAEAITVLHTAAKGAAEQMAESAVGNLTSWVRSQFQSVKPADVPARIQSLYNPYFNDRQALAEPRIWTAAVERLLNEGQRQTWKTECEARDAWRSRSLAAMVLTELEKRITLSPKQREDLGKKLAAVLDEYETDISGIFSLNWHLQGYYAMIPLSLVEEKELNEMFDKKEVETIREKCLGNSQQYADMIRRQHTSRKKSK